MAIYTATSEGSEGLLAATRECVIQLRGVATARAKIIAWGISFDGATAAAVPVLVDFETHSTDGTATGATEYPLDQSQPATALCTAFHSFSAQPTSSGILEQYLIHPQGGLFVREYPPEREVYLLAATTSRVGISVTAPAVVNVTAWLQWDE